MTCKWKRTAYVHVGPSITTSNAYNSAENNQRANWNNALSSAGTSVRYVKSSDKAYCKSKGVYIRGSQYGKTGWAGLMSNMSYTNASGIKKCDIQINFTYVNKYSTHNKNHVIGHEYGRGLGLAHASGKRIMHPSSYTYANPTSADKKIIAALY